ncbi:3'-5' exoribonuclease 1-like [Oratosquilla oratoria]|uniref:3'-5' exoribonuclease 1-like n=1 Tax=Oratosquilla oratoria TaxID=337810 RepID=UPI003F7684BB
MQTNSSIKSNHENEETDLQTQIIQSDNKDSKAENSEHMKKSEGDISAENEQKSVDSDNNWIKVGSEKDQQNQSSSSSHIIDPVFQQLSKINGLINSMKKEEIKAKLRSLRLDTRGKKEVLKKRLKAYYKRRKLAQANLKDPGGVRFHYNHFVVIDFEATCDSNTPNGYRHEIIEFPAVLINTKSKSIVDHFQTYVKPVINPTLTDFCTSLTGITQDKVNSAPKFPEVLQQFEKWLEEHNLFKDTKQFGVVTDGPWDMGRFMLQQCSNNELPFPQWGRKWINIRKSYSNFYNTKRLSLQDMLAEMGMRFEGRPHSGLDDTRNIARIVIQLIKDGANLRVNERIHLAHDGPPDPRQRAVVHISRREFEEMRPHQEVSISEEEEEDDDDAELIGPLADLEEEDLYVTAHTCKKQKSTRKAEPVIDTADMDEFPDLLSSKLSIKK